MGVKVTGARAAGNKLTRYAGALQREVVSILKQEARAHAVEMGSATMPGPGFGETNAAKFQDRVEADVRKIFASKQDPGSIFALMKVHAPHLAGAYWHAHKSNKPRAAADIMRKANLPTGIDPAALKKARTGKKGRVPGPKQPVSLATEAQVRVIVRRQRGLVGLAKAGFYQAAKGLGGRVRRNIVSPAGKRQTEEIFPAYVRKLARKFPDIGGASVTGGLNNPRVEVYSNVPHAGAALPARLHAAAASRAQAKIAAEIRYAAAALNKKGRRAA